MNVRWGLRAGFKGSFSLGEAPAVLKTEVLPLCATFPKAHLNTVTDSISLGSKITMDNECSHEIRRQMLLGRKAMTNLDNMLKSRDITLMKKVCIIKAIIFPVRAGL